MNRFVVSFSKISRQDVSWVGGKAASLGEMCRIKIPVPPGFVVTTTAFDRFLTGADLAVEIEARLAQVNCQDVNSVDKASNVIRDLIHDARMPLDLEKEILVAFRSLRTALVAVRSSATVEDSSQASWAGELETYLNTTRKDLLGKVKACWSSLFTPRAIFYRFEKGMKNAKVSVAVVIQRMIQSEVSGICFTVHPVTKNKNQMIIEAGFGLGEAIVSGQITPDSYVVDKRDFSLLDVNTYRQQKKLVLNGRQGLRWLNVIARGRNKQKLSSVQIAQLAKICLNIERHYKKPQDIEWALASGKFYITQSRPITTL